MGSGVIVDSRGYILTNHHVVDKVQGIEVQLADGTTYPGRVLQYDPVMDLALLKIEPARPLRTITIGTSADLMVGETVITIGNAFGYENTVSLGIISALHRDVTLSDEQVYRNLIQTDASINPGNSGGPLININGELIGINVAVRAGAQGIGFALPIDEVKRVAAEMLSTRRIASTWHGLVVDDLLRGTQRTVVVTEVQPGSPSAAAGFKTGDEVVRVGELAVASMLDVERGLLDSHPGRPTNLLIRRGGADQSLALDVKPLPRGMSVLASSEPGDLVWEILGLKTMPVSTEWVSAVSPKLRGGLYIEAVLARQSRGPGRHPERRYPGWDECGYTPLGDDPAGQYPLRAASARGCPDSGRRSLRCPPQRNPATPGQSGRDASQEDHQPVTGREDANSPRRTNRRVIMERRSTSPPATPPGP